MRTTIIICITLFFVSSAFAQEAKVEKWKAIVAQNKKDTTTLGALDSLFNFYGATVSNDSVFYFAQKVFDLAGELHNDKLQWLVAARRLSERYFEQGKVDSALQLQFKALQVFENAKDSGSISAIYLNIGHAHKEYGDYRKAISYYIKGYDISKAKQNNYGIWAASLNLGYVYAQVNQLDSALYFANMSYEIALNSNNKASIYPSENYLGVVHNKLGNYEVAKDFFLSALQKVTKAGTSFRFAYRGLSYLYLGIANSYAKLNHYDSSLYYARQALIVSSKIFYLKGTVDAQKLLAESFYSLHQIDSAYYYRQLHDVAKDSLYNRDKSSAIESLTFEQELKEKERQAELQKQKEERSHNIQLAITAIAILVFLILFLLISRSILVSHKVVAFLNVVVLLVVFEFINLLMHPFLERVTHHSPVLMLLALVAIAALIVPLHHRLEHWTTKKLVEKNKAIRLAKAKKTIEELEQSTT